MSVFENLQPQKVLYYFETLCAIPHGSGNTKAISDYCVRFAEERKLEVYQDVLNNVIIIKPATVGYENAPAVILQGHLDMVCEKAPDCDLDMKKDGLRLKTDGVWAWAEGTTLGGDDGIAVAMALAALDSDDLHHPRLEVVLTVDEEVGMEGAVGLQTDVLRGRVMLNVDSEVEGVFTVSCAGGVRAACHLPVIWESAKGERLELTVGGLAGGHSGVEIHKGRANANMMMGRLLHEISREIPMRLCALSGGQADNAIASETKAGILVPAGQGGAAEELIAAWEAVFAKEFRTAEPGLKVTVQRKTACTAQVLTEQSAAAVISALVLLPNGVQTMSADIPGLVQTSLNLGVLRLKEDTADMVFAVRSSLSTEKTMLCRRLERLMGVLGGHVTYAGDYPAWEYKADSALRTLVADVYQKQTGKEPVIEAVHAGLECGVFAGKLPGLDCVSLGPDLEEIHTPRERMSIASVERTWELLREVLRRAKELAQ